MIKLKLVSDGKTPGLFKDYKEQTSYGRMASFVLLLASIGMSVGGMYMQTAYHAYILKCNYYFLGAALVFYMISKSPELWNKYAVGIMKTRFGIDLQAGADNVDASTPSQETKK